MINVIERHRRPGDPEILIGDYTKAKDILKWEQQYNDLSRVIETAKELEKA